MPPKNLLVILVTAVVSLACYSVASKNRYANLFAEAMDVINREALYPVEKDELFVDAMNGMLHDLDEYSDYIAGDQFRSFEEDIRQEFGGVGMYVEVDPKTKMLMVLAPMPGTPAYAADLQVGDLIVSIDGEPTLGKQRVEAVKNLRGPIGESVDLEVKRGEQLLTKTLKRATIPIESVHGDYRRADGTWCYRLKEHPNIGYIRLSQFGEKSAVEVRAALEEIVPHVDGVILDIRANAGGLLDVAIEICDMFLPEGLAIVRTRGRNRRLESEYFSESDRVVPSDLPVCILVDRFSASASEILAACLQDHNRAVVIGQQSYGKGTVQNLIPIQRNQSALKLTTQSYWRPSGENIDRYDEESKKSGVWGVQPNEGYQIDLTDDELLANLRARSARDIEGLATGADRLLSEIRSDSNDSANGPQPDDEAGTDPEEVDDNQQVGASTPSQKTHVDRPLQRAIEYLLSLAERSVAA